MTITDKGEKSKDIEIEMRCKENAGPFLPRPGAHGCERLSHLEGHREGKCLAGGSGARIGVGPL